MQVVTGLNRNCFSTKVFLSKTPLIDLLKWILGFGGNIFVEGSQTQKHNNAVKSCGPENFLV